MATIRVFAAFNMLQVQDWDWAVEKLTLTGTAAINGTGNGGGNSLVGNSAANILSGGAGADLVLGGGGNDELRGGAGRDTLTGGTWGRQLRLQRRHRQRRDARHLGHRQGLHRRRRQDRPVDDGCRLARGRQPVAGVDALEAGDLIL